MTRFLTVTRRGITTFGLGSLLASSAAVADVVHLDDVIVDGSACIGFDCVGGESFGFDTLRLKENNLRIKAMDTSTGASFPSNDWQITFNDSTNGGLNKFSIDDITGGRTPFTIEANAPSHSLYVDDGGRVGLGTSIPVVDLHTVSGNTPTLRLEQNGTSGFAPQTWDVAGNETNFFIRDVTGGSALPFRIRPGAPTSALVIDAEGDVGVGVLSANAALHVRGTDGNTMLLVEEASGTEAARALATLRNNGNVFMALEDTSVGGITWNFANLGTDARIVNASNPGVEFSLSQAGALTILGSITTGGGTCGGGCDRVFTADYDLPSITAHSKQMWASGFLPNVGPTLENAPINVSDKIGRMLNELEHAHIYIDQLNKRIEMLEDALTTDKG